MKNKIDSYNYSKNDQHNVYFAFYIINFKRDKSRVNKYRNGNRDTIGVYLYIFSQDTITKYTKFLKIFNILKSTIYCMFNLVQCQITYLF